MNTRYQLFGVWSGIVWFILFWISFAPLMQLFPPPGPALSPKELTDFFAPIAFQVRAGIVVAEIAQILLVPWSMVVYLQMARIEGGNRFLSTTALICNIINCVAFYIPYIFWAGDFYRMDRNPELISLIYDMTWLEFVMIWPPFVMQAVLIGFVGLSDKSPTPVFPRWFCFMSFWVSLLVMPGSIAIFFKNGPFAWNGLFVFWVPFSVFGAYYTAIFWLMFRGVKRQSAEEAGLPKTEGTAFAKA